METNETAADQLQQLKQRIADRPWCELNMQQFYHTELLAARDLLERAGTVWGIASLLLLALCFME